VQTTRRTLVFILAFSFGTSLSAVGQMVIATVPVGVAPVVVAANTASNKIYVANFGNNTVTVIDGATNSTATVTVGAVPIAVAVNPATNKIYVVNYDSGTVTVIDGATFSTSTVIVGALPRAVAANAVTNKIYVANHADGTVTVIDGTTNTTAAVAVGSGPIAVAVNAVTNTIYVANSDSNTVTEIDGATNSTVTIGVESGPIAVAVNPVSNKIYVANHAGGTVTVIDGVTLSTTTVVVGMQPIAAAVNPVSNKIYVANQASGNVTVIDGATLSTADVAVGTFPSAVAVNPVTNKIYVANQGSGTVTMIDGATLSTTTVVVGRQPYAAAVNPVTNRVYITNVNANTVSVIAGANSDRLQFIPVTPCRLFDTRKQGGSIIGGTFRDFVIPDSPCGIPTTAAAYALNVTVVPQSTLSYLKIWPTGEDQPVVSTMNSLDGRIKANAAIVPAGASGAVRVFVTDTADVVLDINGYFASPGSTLAFYPLTPCRVLDTRNANGDLGGPYLQGEQERDFPVLESSCIPQGVTPRAYSMNFTVVPYSGEPLGYLTVWPQGSQRPVVSTLNDLTATIVANAAIVPAGTGGGIAAYASENTQLVGDIDGYFAPAGSGGLSLYPTAPCRVIDTRTENGAFSGELTVNVVNSVCAPPSTTQAYVFNATVVPVGGLGYLTLWPDGEVQPVVSTLNAIDGAITSNMAIMQNRNGMTDAYASGITQLILDISSYFAP
jgi:YVTN family beta-propeller protein